MNATDYFDGRIGIHDTACTIFINGLSPYNISSVPIGTEYNSFGAAEFLKRYDDNLAKFVRHFPDMYVVVSDKKHILVDVKGDRGITGNFSIEADSLYAGIELYKINKPTYFAFVTLPDQDVKLIKADKVNPNCIWIPRWRETQFKDDMVAKFGESKIKIKDCSGGSGTPYVLIPKSHPGFIKLEDFLQIPDGCTFSSIWKINPGTSQQQLIQGVSA